MCAKYLLKVGIIILLKILGIIKFTYKRNWTHVIPDMPTVISENREN